VAKSSTSRTPRVRRRNLGALPVHLPRIEVLVDSKRCLRITFQIA
jgi:hypothetical protein